MNVIEQFLCHLLHPCIAAFIGIMSHLPLELTHLSMVSAFSDKYAGISFGFSRSISFEVLTLIHSRYICLLYFV